MRYLFLILFLGLTAHAQEKSGIYIKVQDAKLKKSLLAMPPLQYVGSKGKIDDYKKVGANLFNQIVEDLDVSSYFQFINQNAFLEDTSKTGLRPAPGHPNGFRFNNWDKIGTEFLIRAGYRIVNSEVELEAYLYYVPKAEMILGKKYNGSSEDVHLIAHSFADDVLEKLTGKKGMFTSKIVFSSDRAGNKWKEIYISDWNGKNMKRITNHRSISISPAWSPDGKSITYTAFAYHKKTKTRNADLFLYEVFTGKRFLLSARKGINSGSTFSPDGKHIYLTISQKGNPDIYRMNLDGKGLLRLTSGPRGAMNVEPNLNPEGSKIAFSSDRSGQPMVYVMNKGGGSAKRITFAGRYNASPSWSPDGKRIAFAGFDKGHFDLFIVDANGLNLERLTTARKVNGKLSNNENPDFSPDGRHIIFISDRSGKKQIYMINTDGTNERRITYDNHNYYQPKWGTVTN